MSPSEELIEAIAEACLFIFIIFIKTKHRSVENANNFRENKYYTFILDAKTKLGSKETKAILIKIVEWFHNLS